jgi:hypothetical protein
MLDHLQVLTVLVQMAGLVLLLLYLGLLLLTRVAAVAVVTEQAVLALLVAAMEVVVLLAELPQLLIQAVVGAAVDFLRMGALAVQVLSFFATPAQFNILLVAQ